MNIGQLRYPTKCNLRCFSLVVKRIFPSPSRSPRASSSVIFALVGAPLDKYLYAAQRTERHKCIGTGISIHIHVEKPTEVASSPSELRLPACGETAEKLISVGGRRFKRLPAGGGDVAHATIEVVLRGIDGRACAGVSVNMQRTYRGHMTRKYIRKS